MMSAKHDADLREAALVELGNIADGCRSSTLWKDYIRINAAKEGITADEEIDEFHMAWCNAEIPPEDQCRHIHDYLSYVECSGNDHGYNIGIILDILDIDLTKTESFFQTQTETNAQTQTDDTKDMTRTEDDMTQTGDDMTQIGDGTRDDTGDGYETEETEGESDLAFRYPPAPSADHPSIKCILGSAAKVGSLSQDSDSKTNT